MALTPFLLAWIVAYRLLPFQRTIWMFFVSFSVYVKNSTLSHSPPMSIRPKESYYSGKVATRYATLVPSTWK